MGSQVAGQRVGPNTEAECWTQIKPVRTVEEGIKPYHLEGTVVKGHQRGRELNCKTGAF